MEDLVVRGNIKNIDVYDDFSAWAKEHGFRNPQDMVNSYYDGDIATALDMDDSFAAAAALAKKEGYDGVRITTGGLIGSGKLSADATIVFDPRNIRSRHAAFDPAKKDSADLMAGVAGTGVATGALLAGEEEGFQEGGPVVDLQARVAAARRAQDDAASTHGLPRERDFADAAGEFLQEELGHVTNMGVGPYLAGRALPAVGDALTGGQSAPEFLASMIDPRTRDHFGPVMIPLDVAGMGVNYATLGMVSPAVKALVPGLMAAGRGATEALSALKGRLAAAATLSSTPSEAQAGPNYFSMLERMLPKAGANPRLGGAWKNHLRKLGAKPEEIDYRFQGMADDQQVRLDELQAYLAKTASPEPKDVLLGGDGGGGPTQYAQWQLGGGEDYKELLLTLPQQYPKLRRSQVEPTETASAPFKAEWDRLSAEMRAKVAVAKALMGRRWWRSQNNTDIDRLSEELDALHDKMVDATIAENPRILGADAFTGSHHSDYPNVMAHVRFNTRTGPNNERVLFLEEVQSDWHQKGKKKGYKKDAVPEIQQNAENTQAQFAAYLRTMDLTDREVSNALARTREGHIPSWVLGDKVNEHYATDMIDAWRALDEAKRGVPDAPFKKSWTDLTMNRMVKYAAENGYDRIAWTTGKHQIDRYESALRQKVDRIEWEKTKDGVQIKGYKVEDIADDPDSIIRAHARTLTEGLRPRKEVVNTRYKETDLSDAIGKLMGKRILDDSAQSGVIEGEDIAIESVGMNRYYNQSMANAGGKHGKVDLINLGGDVGEVQSFVVPQVDKEGFQLFQEGGSVRARLDALKNPAEYYKQTPLMRSMWEGHLPTWLGQAYEQDVKPVVSTFPEPMTMEGALFYGALPAK